MSKNLTRFRREPKARKRPTAREGGTQVDSARVVTAAPSESILQTKVAHHDRRAIIDYTSPGFAVINKALRSGAATADVQTRIDAVLLALCQFRSSHWSPWTCQRQQRQTILQQEAVVVAVHSCSVCYVVIKDATLNFLGR